VSTFVPLSDLLRKRSLVEFIQRDRREASAFDRRLKKALSSGQNDLLTSNERLQLLGELQPVPGFCFLIGFLGLGRCCSVTDVLRQRWERTPLLGRPN
jgi:hypothetical protein